MDCEVATSVKFTWMWCTNNYRKHEPIQPTCYVNRFVISWKSLVCYLKSSHKLYFGLVWSLCYQKPLSVWTFCIIHFGVALLLQSLLLIKGIVWPILDYAAQVWNPHTAKNIDILEPVNRHANGIEVFSFIWWCLSSLHWSTLKIVPLCFLPIRHSAQLLLLLVF